MDSELVVPSRVSGHRPAYLACRPALFLSIVLGAVAAAGAYKVRTEGIFACGAAGYSSERYLSYCHNPGYGDYEHGAFWFELEPSIRESIANADVLYLGSSRMQLGLSTDATADWFSSAPARYYLMGFAYNENAVFAEQMLAKYRPRAKVYVVNIERFFNRTETVPTKTVMRDPQARLRYEVKRFWQYLHRPICGAIPRACGDDYVVFRSRKTGAYSVWGLGQFKNSAVSYDDSIDKDELEREVAIGRDFLSHLPVGRDCVILTAVPYVRTRGRSLSALATALGLNLVAPTLEGLVTFDESHLDRPSAERWSRAFLNEAAPQIRRCLGLKEAAR